MDNRFYIVDYKGNTWGDFSTLEKAQSALNNYTDEEIKENELEIIEG